MLGVTAAGGRAAAQMLFAYFDREIGKDWQARLVAEATQSGGVEGQTLKDCFVAAGFSTAVFRGQPDQSVHGIFRYLGREVPLLLMLDAGAGKIKHCVILNGYDHATRAYRVIDPVLGPRRIPERQFMDAWQNASFFTLLAYPSEASP